MKKGVVCQNLEEIAVLNANDIFEILQRGIQQRQTAETLCNKNSSRSHSIFTMKIMIKEYNVEGEEVVRHGQLNLVDLAGSECIGRSGAKNDRAREAGSINQSLLTLGRVITALVDHHGHIPYRDSKLTRLLQESLGGKAKTCIIATLSPSQTAVEESMSTLDYAHRAKNIKNQPTINQKLTKKVIMKEYFAEIETLRNQLIATREKNGVYLDPADFYAMESRISTQEAQLTECEAALRSRNEEVKLLKQDNEQLTTNLERVTNELSVATQELTEAKSQLTVVKEELQVAFVELRATEEVVKEQAATEAELKKTIERLHGIIEEKQGEVSSLLSKVSVLEGKEEERLQQSQSFTASILQQQSSLQQMISTLTKETDEQSASIEKGIEEMLKTGRKTCDVLKESIAAALKVLIEDTKVSKEFMKQSCETMTSDLMSSEKVYVGAIEGLAKEFSQYFQDNEDKMEGIQATLREQVEQMDRLTQQLEQSQEKMMEELRAYSKAENEACTAIQTQLKEWMAQFRGRSERHVSSANEMYGKNQAALSQKAKEIQDTMTSMLSEFMKMSDGMMSASLQETESFVKESTAFSEKQSEEVSEKVKGLHERYVTANEQLTSLQQSSMSRFSSDMEVVGSSNKRTNESSAEVVQLVKAKKEVMASSMKDLGESYQAITKKTCHGVQSVMQCSEKILADVTNTTVKMNEQTSGEIEQFLTFLRGNGDELSQQINRHFSHTKSQYVVEDEVVLKSREEIEQYGKEMKESKVVRSGRTPRKMHAFTAQPIRSTKSHNKIKSEARQAPSSSSSGALKDITYEVIRQEIPKYKQSAEVVEDIKMDVFHDSSPLAIDILATASVEGSGPASLRPGMMTRTNSTDSVSMKSIASVSSEDLENAHPNASTTAATTSVSKIATRSTRSASKSRVASANISTRSRSGSTVMNAVTTVDPSLELDFN